MANIFKHIEWPKVPKSVQDMSHTHVYSGNMGELIPVTYIDCLPGTNLTLDNEALARFMPLTAPVMDRFIITFHRWFVPKRLLWDNWENYITMTPIGSPLALPVHPYVTISPGDMRDLPGLYNRLANYMGVPLRYDPATQNTSVNINPMRFAAYQFICNQNYRDQNLMAPFAYKLTDGDNSTNADLLTLRKRSWNADYFTSGLPAAQKGDPVLMPVIMSDSIVRRNVNPATGSFSQWPVTSGQTNPLTVPEKPIVGTVDATGQALYADNSTSSSTTDLNEFRIAYALQRLKERLMRIGSRLKEYLPGIFGVKPMDYRLDQPEYAGGVLKPITISEVLNTGDATLPQGNMAGHAATYISGSESHYKAHEHGYLITIMNIQPKGTYFQGLDREFSKINHPTEIYTPDMANLGEQGTYNDELYSYTSTAKETFNYQAKWTEHRFIPNRVFGQLAIENNLMHWTAARYFANQPLFNEQFKHMVTGQGSTDRIFAVNDPDEEKLIIQVYNKVIAVQPVPKFGIPSL